MSRSNKKLIKSKRKEQKKKNQLSKRVDFYGRILKISQVYDLFNKLPNNMRQYVYSISWPNINISCEKITDDIGLENKIKKRLDNTFLNIHEQKIPLSEIYGLLGIIDGIKSVNNYFSIVSKKTDKFKHSNIISNEILNKLLKIWKEICEEYTDLVVLCASQEILSYFNFHEIGLFPTLKLCHTGGKKTFISIIINKSIPVEEKLSIEGKIRKIYKCFDYKNYINLSDCELPIDVIDNKIALKVYIQDHAIKRLIERINIKPYGYIFDCVARSLSKPKVVGKDGESYLLEFNYYSYKLGYLVISIHKNIAVIRTFKFITMAGTPEYYKLSKELKGTKEEFEYWGLHSLDIVNSDISKDGKLLEIFNKCDLGHLLKFSAVHGVENPKFEIASEIRKHFKL